jgi:hypothetical protein
MSLKHISDKINSLPIIFIVIIFNFTNKVFGIHLSKLTNTFVTKWTILLKKTQIDFFLIKKKSDYEMTHFVMKLLWNIVLI